MTHAAGNQLANLGELRRPYARSATVEEPASPCSVPNDEYLGPEPEAVINAIDAAFPSLYRLLSVSETGQAHAGNRVTEIGPNALSSSGHMIGMVYLHL
jgi:hypothetical protein